jgi:hypothetical protein
MKYKYYLRDTTSPRNLETCYFMNVIKSIKQMYKSAMFLFAT